MPFGENYHDNISRERAEAYKAEIEQLYPIQPGEADERFRRLLENIGPYLSDKERANALASLISEVRYPEHNASESVADYYRNMPQPVKERLLDLLDRELRRLEVKAEEDEARYLREKRADEKERHRMLSTAGLLSKEKTSEFQPSVVLMGKKYFYELFGFKVGDKVKNPDPEHPGEWVIIGTYSAYDDEAGVTLVRPDVAEEYDRIKAIEDETEKWKKAMEMDERGHEKVELDQFALKKLRNRLNQN